MVELVIKDTTYDVPTHVQLYEELKAEVAAIVQSTGSPHTSAIADSLGEDNMFAIPLSWYSGWPHNENVLELGGSYCFESMNMVSWMDTVSDPGWTLAVMSFPGEYGQDSAFGAKYAAEQSRIQHARDLKKRGIRRYTAVGIIELRPDVLGRTPAYRMNVGGKLKCYIIAPAYDLRRFKGKRVGVIGIQDRESGTGYHTVMVKRIEIIGDK